MNTASWSGLEFLKLIDEDPADPFTQTRRQRRILQYLQGKRFLICGIHEAALALMGLVGPQRLRRAQEDLANEAGAVDAETGMRAMPACGGGNLGQGVGVAATVPGRGAFHRGGPGRSDRWLSLVRPLSRADAMAGKRKRYGADFKAKVA